MGTLTLKEIDGWIFRHVSMLNDSMLAISILDVKMLEWVNFQLVMKFVIYAEIRH